MTCARWNRLASWMRCWLSRASPLVLGLARSLTIAGRQDKSPPAIAAIAPTIRTNHQIDQRVPQRATAAVAADAAAADADGFMRGTAAGWHAIHGRFRRCLMPTTPGLHAIDWQLRIQVNGLWRRRFGR